MTLQSEKKKLESELNELGKEVDDLSLEVKSSSAKLEDKSSQLSELKDKLRCLKKAERIKITDHALLRYIERMLGIDVDKIRNEIINDKTRYQVYILGDGKYPVDNNHFAVIKNNTLITVYPVRE